MCHPTYFYFFTFTVYSEHIEPWKSITLRLKSTKITFLKTMENAYVIAVYAVCDGIGNCDSVANRETVIE